MRVGIALVRGTAYIPLQNPAQLRGFSPNLPASFHFRTTAVERRHSSCLLGDGRNRTGSSGSGHRPGLVPNKPSLSSCCAGRGGGGRRGQGCRRTRREMGQTGGRRRQAGLRRPWRRAAWDWAAAPSSSGHRPARRGQPCAACRRLSSWRSQARPASMLGRTRHSRQSKPSGDASLVEDRGGPSTDTATTSVAPFGHVRAARASQSLSLHETLANPLGACRRGAMSRFRRSSHARLPTHGRARFISSAASCKTHGVPGWHGSRARPAQPAASRRASKKGVPHLVKLGRRGAIVFVRLKTRSHARAVSARDFLPGSQYG